MPIDFSFSDEEKEEEEEKKKEEEKTFEPRERVETPPETEKRRCILCGTEMKTDLGFICNECRDRLLARTRLGHETEEEEKKKTIKF